MQATLETLAAEIRTSAGERDGNLLRRIGFFAYGVTAYLLFLVTCVLAFGFLGNVIVPNQIDSPATSSPLTAAIVNVLLLGLFAVQHSVMARPTFKRWWTRYVPEPIERSTYVLLSNVVLWILFWQWQPMTGVVWEVENPIGRYLLLGLFGAGWIVVLTATAMLNHFDLFGLRQVWLHLRGRPYSRLTFKLPLFYRWVRHPLYVGWLMTFWSTPRMSLGHLLFAAVTTAYILVAIYFEERNLIEVHGESYAAYRRRVPMLLPWPRRRSPKDSTSGATAAT